MRMQTCFRLFRLLAVLLCAAAPAAAQEITVRLSVKFILSSSGARPSGTYSTDAAIQNDINRTNEALRRWGRGYRYVITEFKDVAGASSFFNVFLDSNNNPQTGGYYGLEDTAKANPTKFSWREDATNIFIVNTLSFAGGAGAIPSAPGDQRGPGQPPYELVVISVNNGPDFMWAHELGHHNDLYHTWDDDGIADTRQGPTPLQCTVRGGDVRGGNQECSCVTKLAILDEAARVGQPGGWSQQQRDDILYNIMSYHCYRDFNNIRMTEGQLDKWADATRRYHRGEVSGLTFFVDLNRPSGPPTPDGLSTNPYRTVAEGFNAAVAEFSLPEDSAPGSGNIVLVRGGNYNERITLTAPPRTTVTLRAPRGSVVTIGRP